MRLSPTCSARPFFDPIVWAMVGTTSAGRGAPGAAPRRPRAGSPRAPSAAAWSASLVLPEPPGPVSVTSRCSPSSAAQLVELALAADERGRLRRQVRRVQRLQGRELGFPELVELLRLREILEPVRPEVAKREAVHLRACPLRQDDLAAVGARADARSPVDVEPRVALRPDDRLAGVEAHADADRSSARAPPAPRRPPPRRRALGEGDEERVSLRVHLDAAVRVRTPRGARADARQRLRVPVAELVQQAASSPRCR